MRRLAGDADPLPQGVAAASAQLDNARIATECLDESIAALQRLQSLLDAETFGRAVHLMQRADSIWLLGSQWSFPIAACLEYALRHTDKRVGLISGLGGMQLGEARSIRRGDLLIAISCAPHAPQTLEILEDARRLGASLIAITDSLIGQLPDLADCCLVVQDRSRFGFRSLTSTLGLAQSLFLALAYRLELQPTPGTQAG
jgi:DNA-binding MurR/RpiR family transcriptional regulator